ncbi:MAG: hypothetical protein WBA46_01255 [Thermomicrobiales bacterium]
MTTLDTLVDAIHALRLAVRSTQREFDVPFGAKRSLFMSRESAELLFPVIATHLDDRDEQGSPKIWCITFAGDTFSILINDDMGDLIDAI